MTGLTRAVHKQPLHGLGKQNNSQALAEDLSRRHDSLIDLLDGRATRATCWRTPEAAARHASLWHTATTTGGLVDLHHDGIDDTLQLLLLALEFILLGKLIFVKPIQSLLYCVLYLLLVPVLEFLLELLFLKGISHGEAIVFQAILGFDFGAVGLVLCPELLSLLHHTIDLRLREAALLVCDGDLVGLACRFVLRRHIQNTIGIDVERHLDLGNAAWCGWDTIQVELAEQIVVLRHGPLAFEHLDQYTGLVVCIGGECLPLLGWDGCVALDELRHHATC